MMYSVSRFRGRTDWRHEKYKVYNSLTDNTFGMGKKQIYRLIQNGIPFANFCIKDNKLYERDWSTKGIGRLDHYCKSTLVCINDAEIPTTYKLVNERGYLETISKEYFNILVEKNQISNVTSKCICRAVQYDYRNIEHQSKMHDAKFDISVKNKYDTFILKTAMLGYDERFIYSIRGKEVIYEKYIGASKHLIIPGFVTVLAENCILGKNARLGEKGIFGNSLESLIINPGVQFIEDSAFLFVNINKATIPSSVKYLGADAFSYSTNILDHGKYNNDNIHIENPQYTIMGQYEEEE